MDTVEVVVAHSERATLRVGDTFLKVDADPERLEHEAEALALAPVPTPRVLWRQPLVLALDLVPGSALGVLGEQSPASREAWEATGAVVRRLHDSAFPPWPGRGSTTLADDLDAACEWLVGTGVLPSDLVARNREVAAAASRPWEPVFVHGDLQITHVFTEADEVTGVIDWSEAGPGDPMRDLAVLTLGHEERLDQLLDGYGPEGVDRDAIVGWWSLRSLLASRWLIEHGFDPNAPGCEFDVLRARMPS